MQQLTRISIIVVVLLAALFALSRAPAWFSGEKGGTEERAAQGAGGARAGENTPRTALRTPGAPRTLEDLSEATKSFMEGKQTITARLITNRGTVVLSLDAGRMPLTVGNFVELARGGFYDGVRFHRVIGGFMIQAGDPLTKDESQKARWGTGGPGYTIKDEFVAGEGLSNVRGTIAMANTGLPDSGGSQFFINVGDNTGLDFDKPPATSKHPVFGRVVVGMDVVDAIANTATDAVDRPVEEVVIERIEVE